MNWTEYPEKMLKIKLEMEQILKAAEAPSSVFTSASGPVEETPLETATRLLKYVLYHLKNGEKVPEKVTQANVWWASELIETVDQIEEFLKEQQ